MEEVLKGESGAVFLFLYLFPVFLGSIVYDFLVQGKKRESFDRIVDALVLTLLSSVALKVLVRLPLLPLVIDSKTPLTTVIDAFVGRNLLYGSFLSVTIAAALAVLNNRGITYGVLHLLRITNNQSSLDVWADTFDRLRGFWIRVRFKDGSSLIGWPKFYSQSGAPRELFLAEAA